MNRNSEDTVDKLRRVLTISTAAALLATVASPFATGVAKATEGEGGGNGNGEGGGNGGGEGGGNGNGKNGGNNGFGNGGNDGIPGNSNVGTPGIR
ncbi:hypothetical protein I6F07_03165 [Ensifer sp. IC4062]|nr:hypothetical protein [Ensifer sp. IC4062]MCA1439236.1 hypothetical protein [Ensifer sp. IC4062]